MKEIVIRKESYGLIIFVPDKQSYYRVYEKKLIKYFLDSIKNNNYDLIKKEFYNEFKELELDKYPKRFIDNSIYGNDIFIPLEAYFDYTSCCNKNCSYCYNKKYLGNVTMKKDMVRKIFDDFYQLGIMRVHLAGGEPTINYQGIKNYIEYGRSLGMIISLATNGTHLTDDICELLTTNDLFSVSISLDSAIEEKNDLTRGNGTYQEVIKGLTNLYAHKIKNNSDVKICIKPVFYPSITREEINNLIAFCKQYNIDLLKFSNPERCEEHNLHYYGNIKNEYYRSIKKLQDIIHDEKELKINNVSNPYLYNFIIGIEENKGCIGAQELITINPDGRITPCLMNHYLLGNIYDYKNILDYLKNCQRLKEYLKIISNYDCHDCKIHSSCRGGCQVRKKVEYGEIKEIDPLCPIEYLKEKENIEEKKLIMRKVNVYHSL